MSHRLKSLDKIDGLAGVAEPPQASEINGCDTKPALESLSETPAKPGECRTSAEIDRRLFNALYEVRRSALGMPSDCETFKAMLAKAGLALVLDASSYRSDGAQRWQS